ncbi:hypothetical protein [Actinoplanes sp. GCM10030250]|uniref:hypothetical protein n=1 Tax=Actinoplanes sp. GCM10030250 TaxID=3273376 RepID=UPI00360EF675
MRRKSTLAIIAAALTTAGIAPSAAEAGLPRTTTALLGTYDHGRARIIGEQGLAAGFWTSFSVFPGAAGDDLVITYVPRSTPRRGEREVYTAAFDRTAEPRTECEEVGADGVARQVWVSSRCRTGFAPSYTLLVR